MSASTQVIARPGIERRAHRRLDINLPLELRCSDNDAAVLVRTITQNVSTGGFYIELDRRDFSVNDELDFQLTVPPMEGVSPYVGRATGRAVVLRVHPARFSPTGEIERYGIAAAFQGRLRISY